MGFFVRRWIELFITTESLYLLNLYYDKNGCKYVHTYTNAYEIIVCLMNRGSYLSTRHQRCFNYYGTQT